MNIVVFCSFYKFSLNYSFDNQNRLLLWDCDDRYYSYYIEVSVNMWDWQLVADKSKELVRSWQLLQFSSRPVVFIRITGTFNSANEVSLFNQI